MRLQYIETFIYLQHETADYNIEYNGNIYRVFFIFDEEKIVVLFNGFQKKTQKTPTSQIAKALKIKEGYYEYKRNNDSGL